MGKKYSVFIAVLFCLFLAGFGTAHLILPDRTFSEQENRYLSQFKAPTFSTILSGKFMEDFEDYVVDQFPLRDQWIQLKAFSEAAIGKKENNEVYFGRDGQTLFAQFTAPTQEELEEKVDYINQLAEHLTVPVYFSLIPDKSYVWSDLLPVNAPLADDGSTLEQAADLCSQQVTWIDLRESLQGDAVYYRTDHHWTTMGAYQGYLTLVSAMGTSSITPADPPVLVSDSFYGTTYSASGAGWVNPDEIYLWVPETEQIEVTSYSGGEPEQSTLYHASCLDQKDKYSFFLGGNQPLCLIENPDAQNGKLLVIRDSFSDALAPFLSQNYQEVWLLDPRYSSISIPSFVEEQKIDTVLVLYSVSDFSTDSNLFKLSL